MEGISPNPGDPFVAAAAVAHAVEELEPTLDGVGEGGEEVGGKIWGIVVKPSSECPSADFPVGVMSHWYEQWINKG